MKSKVLTGTVSVLAALSLALTGCNTGKAPSKAALVTKLKSESDLASLKAAGTDAQYDSFISCIADYLLKKGKKKDLSDYVAGKKKIDDVKGFDSEANAEKEAQACAKTAGYPV